MFFYAARTDKNGHRLLTSYNNAASQKKYGGAEADTFDGVMVLNGDGEFDKKSSLEDVQDEDHVVRSRMYNPNPENTKTGKFVIRSITDGGIYEDTPFRTNSYGAANTIMKAIIPMYQELIIVEEGALPYGGSSGTSTGGAPF